MNRKIRMSTEDPVIQVVENNKENIDILNTFSKEFFSTNNVINEKINNILSKIDALTVEEKQKENLLNILESKITPIELGNTLKHLVEQRVMLNDKYNDLNNTIINNNKKIEMISNTIRDNKQIVDSVYKIIGVLDDNINSINNTLNTRNI
jgi:CHASE3 domain sensor protein